MDTLARLLATDSGVSPDYRHGPKQVAPGEPLLAPGAVLKWYAVHADDRPVPEAITRLARERLVTRPLDARGFGFVVLHRCGQDFYFLIVCTWRNNNELWESVLYKDGDAFAQFEPFARDGSHLPTLCVWELAPVWHEQQAWVRFLASSRDQAAAQAWLGDRCSGTA